MKKAILIQILLFIGFGAMAQNKTNSSILENCANKIATKIQSNKVAKSMSLKTILLSDSNYKKESTDKYLPTFSVDILDGSGIHLFTTPNFGPIPSMNVGARLHAGIKISI